MKLFLNTPRIANAVSIAAILIGGSAATYLAPQTAWAQSDIRPSATLDLKDVPIRAALEQLFQSAGADYSIDPNVRGYITLKVTDIPFENALKLILRSSVSPLTYSKEGGVYIVKHRTVTESTPPPPALALAPETPPRSKFELIEMTYADPADLAQLLNITMIPIGTRHGLKVPGQSGVINPGGGASRGGGSPTVSGGGGNGAIINSGGSAGGQSGNGGVNGVAF